MFLAVEKYLMGKYGKPKNNWAGGISIVKEFNILGRRIRFKWQDSEGLGRFGGGWNIELGLQIGGSTVIINLIFCSIRIDKRRGK